MKPNHFTKALSALVLAAVVAASLLKVFAQSAHTVSIAPLGTNQFQIGISNGVGTATYELWWTPALNDPLYGWSIIQTGAVGQVTFDIDAGDWPAGYFRTSVEQTYNGIPDYQWANPNDPSLGALAITIDSPTNGMVLQ